MIQSEKLTRNAADLAKLDLSEEELKAFTAQLGDILNYVDQLQQVEVGGVEPLFHLAPERDILRDDVEVPSLLSPEGAPRALESAPDVLNGGFKVPPIL